ncbi:hypothetical protein G7059_00140 [Erysipelothrix sp. HDW6A]|uniref:hypothetical protein n=1 Tax=Erysipelothrix sp. HDW6A TaxID=2714928 RepID=UPI00140C4FD2|nr:hypothetical protein [Erysipelothrix sp. HDW6A]QIK56364.1 hypothetical protein G7059_00140 [Erysipelothrix sp. HDW6A]
MVKIFDLMAYVVYWMWDRLVDLVNIFLYVDSWITKPFYMIFNYERPDTLLGEIFMLIAGLIYLVVAYGFIIYGLYQLQKLLRKKIRKEN